MPRFEAQGSGGKGTGFRTGTCSIRTSFSHPPQPSKREAMNRVLQALILPTSLHNIDLDAKPVSIILLDSICYRTCSEGTLWHMRTDSNMALVVAGAVGHDGIPSHSFFHCPHSPCSLASLTTAQEPQPLVRKNGIPIYTKILTKHVSMTTSDSTTAYTPSVRHKHTTATATLTG